MSEMTPAAQAAAEIVAGAAQLVEAPEQGEQPAPAQTETAPEAPALSFEADTQGIEDLLAPEDEAEEEEDDYQEPPQEPESYDQYDPGQLQARIKKLEKQNKFLEEQRVTQGRKQWKAEAEKRFPLADVDDIQATSRRAFLRKAAESHQRYQKKLEPILGRLDGIKQEATAAVKAEQRAATAKGWGPPTTGPQQPLVETAEQETSRQHALDRRNHRSVADMVKARFEHDPNFNEGI